jgi:hypothetical protein
VEEAKRQYPRARIKWPVVVKTPGGTIDGVTLDLNPDGGFIRCPKPLRLNELFDMSLKAANADEPITATAEVVWSNIYGPDDEITPRGMGFRFTKISDEDRKCIAKAALEHLKSKNVDQQLLQGLETIIAQ